jgi:tryptophan synthase alpha chain
MSPSTSSDPGVPAASATPGTPIAEAFRAASREDRAALVMYVTAGYPDPGATPAVLDMLAEEGADVIEFCVPFSDPLADGPVIQAASNRAIGHGVDMRWVLRTLADFRDRHDTAVVLFSYLNPILRYGLDAFLADASAAGADGVLLTDLPLGCDPAIERRFTESSLDLVRLVAPTSAPERAAAIAGASSGFVYYVSRTGVTGEQSALSTRLA